MASTRLLLEGSNIEDLLERVRAEYGPGVRIVEANRLRTGGVGGFFAREKFAVTIEIDDADVMPEAATSEREISGPSIAEQIAAGQENSETAAKDVDLTALPTAAAAASSTGTTSSSPSASTFAPNPFAAGSSSPAAFSAISAAPIPAMSMARSVTQPGTLLELAEAIDAAEASEAHITMSTAGMSDTPREPLPESQSDAAPAGPMLPPGHAPLSTDGTDFAALLAGLAKTTRAANGLAPEPAAALAPIVPIGPADVPSANLPAPVPPASHLVDEAVEQYLSGAAGHEATDPYTEAGRRKRTAATAHVGVEGAGNPLVRRLLALGLPRELAQQLSGVGVTTLKESLVRVLEDRPVRQATNLQAGEVLVIVGPGAAAYDVACEVSRRLRLDPADVLLAAPSDLGVRIDPEALISGPVDARRRSARLRRSAVPTVVAVDAPCDGESHEWARAIADGLDARVTWALVDATSKPADLLDHLAGLGPLDGLVVRGTAASRDPASVLQPALELSLPTVLVDGHSGDAEAWAALLIDRISELP